MRWVVIVQKSRDSEGGDILAKAKGEGGSGFEKSESFRLLFSLNPLPMMVFRYSDFRFVEVNEAAVGTYGYSRDEFLAMTVYDILPQEDVPRLSELLNRLPRLDAAVRGATGWRHRLKNGSLIDIEVHSQGICFEGQVARLAVVINITPKLQNEAALIDREERLRLALESANMGTWDLNLTTGELDWSDRCRALIQLSADEEISYEKFLAYVHGDDRARLQQAIADAVQPGHSGEYQVQYRALGARTGESIWISARGRVLRGEDGRALRFLGTAVDITEQKRAEELLRACTDELRASNQELEKFASVVSHSLREPLRMISSFLALLTRRYGECLDREAMEYISFAVSGAKRLRQLIVSLERIAEIGPVCPRECDMSETVEHALRGLRETIVALHADIDVQRLPIVWCEPSLIECVFQNLVANSLEYRRPELPPHIQIEATERATEWEFTVTDNGCGLDEWSSRRIFDPFVRLGTDAEESGRGIGLAVTKKIIECHGGRVWVESRIGQGAVFHFCLPKPPRASVAGARN